MNLLKSTKSHSIKRVTNPRKVSTVKKGFTLILYYAHYSIFVNTFKGVPNSTHSVFPSCHQSGFF